MSWLIKVNDSNDARWKPEMGSGSLLPSLEPKVAGSNPAEAVGFFRAKKSSTRLPSDDK
jgi:hypothetical protein